MIKKILSALTITAIPIAAQAATWQVVDSEDSAAPGTWEEIHCQEGGGWQVCERQSEIALTGRIFLPRDAFQSNFGGTRNLSRIRAYQSIDSQVVNGSNYSFDDAGGGWTASPVNLRVSGIVVGKPVPSSWPHNNCDIRGGEFSFCIPGPMSGGMEVILRMPTAITIQSARSFKQLEQAGHSLIFMAGIPLNGGRTALGAGFITQAKIDFTLLEI